MNMAFHKVSGNNIPMSHNKPDVGDDIFGKDHGGQGQLAQITSGTDFASKFIHQPSEKSAWNNDWGAPSESRSFKYARQASAKDENHT